MNGFSLSIDLARLARPNLAKSIDLVYYPGVIYAIEPLLLIDL